jgi:single-stranded-DNA-specific exonuclease
MDESGFGVAAEPSLTIDAEIGPERLTIESARLLGILEPFGQDNRAPQLLVRNVKVNKWEAIGQDKSHLRLTLATPRGVCKAVIWGAADRSREFVVNRDIDLVGILSVDTWNGSSRPQVEIKDFRPAT